MDEETIKTYNALAKDYDEETADFWESFPSTIIKEFTKTLPVAGRVLDAGSGPGRGALLLRDQGMNVVCFDASETMVELCKSKDFETVLGDFLKLPFADESFDGVWSYTSLLHIKKNKINDAVKESRRVLKKDGVFGLGMIEGEDELYRESSGVRQPRWFAFYTKDELEKLLISNGFEVRYFEEFKPKSKNYLNFIAKKL